MVALRDPKVWQFIAIFFCIIMANSTLTFFGPSVVKEVGFDQPGDGRLDHGDRLPLRRDRHDPQRQEFGPPRRGPLSLRAGGSDRGRGHGHPRFLVPNVPYLALVALTLAIVGTMSAIPVFWQMPNQFLAGSAAAAGIALINSVANLAGFGAPYAMGVIKDMTGSMSIGLWLVAAFEAATVLLIIKFIPAPRRELVQHAEEVYGKAKTA